MSCPDISLHKKTKKMDKEGKLISGLTIVDSFNSFVFKRKYKSTTSEKSVKDCGASSSKYGLQPSASFLLISRISSKAYCRLVTLLSI